MADQTWATHLRSGATRPSARAAVSRREEGDVAGLSAGAPGPSLDGGEVANRSGAAPARETPWALSLARPPPVAAAGPPGFAVRSTSGSRLGAVAAGGEEGRFGGVFGSGATAPGFGTPEGVVGALGAGGGLGTAGGLTAGGSLGAGDGLGVGGSLGAGGGFGAGGGLTGKGGRESAGDLPVGAVWVPRQFPVALRMSLPMEEPGLAKPRAIDRATASAIDRATAIGICARATQRVGIVPPRGWLQFFSAYPIFGRIYRGRDSRRGDSPPRGVREEWEFADWGSQNACGYSGKGAPSEAVAICLACHDRRP